MGLTLPITDFITVSVNAAGQQISPLAFNQGLIVGPSTIIPSTGGSNPRIRQYASLAAMSSDGFSVSNPEYNAASLYFAQGPSVPNFAWIGRQDLTALQTIIPHSGAAGTGYVVGDVITVVQGGASAGEATVTAATAGVVTALSVNIIGHQGTGYATATGLTTTGGTGTGLEVDITAVGETYAQAVQACQLVNNSWFPFGCCNATDSDHTACAALASASPYTMQYMGTTADAAVLNGTSGNIALTLQSTKSNSLLIYSTTQSGQYPNNVYSWAAVMGQACGLNSGLAGSAFTLAFKVLTSVGPEPITQTQYTNIVNANCNVYSNFGAYTFFTPGILGSGLYYDQILYRAMTVNQIQTNLMNVLTSTPKVAQTDPAEHQLIQAVNNSMQNMADIGYVGPGTWTGGPIILNTSNGQTLVTTGQSLPSGYAVGSNSYAYQSQANKQARQAMPIYAALIEAGAVQSVAIQVNVQL